jgi:microcystin-dependent protein
MRNDYGLRNVLEQDQAHELRIPPKGWALCNGQLLPINQNQTLFSPLGTTFGADGRVNLTFEATGGVRQ